MHLRGRGEVALHLDLASSAVARRAFALLRAFDIDSEIRTYQQHAFDRPTRYQLHVEGTPHALRDAAPAGRARRLAPAARAAAAARLARRCCRGAYLRGALLGAGSLSGPRDPHLEIRTAEAEGARFLAEVAARGAPSCSCSTGAATRSRTRRESSAIADVLVAAGASDTVLVLEESAVLGAIRADANRLANADHANLVRTSRAAHAQLDAVRRLERSTALPDDLLRDGASCACGIRPLSTAELASTLPAAAHESVGVPARLRRLVELAAD